MVLAGEERLPIEHLCKYTPRTPDVDFDIILLPCKHDLGGAVVSRRHITGHLRVLNAGQTKIANLQVAVFVNEDIAGLEITVHDPGGVDIFQTSLKD